MTPSNSIRNSDIEVILNTTIPATDASPIDFQGLGLDPQDFLFLQTEMQKKPIKGAKKFPAKTDAKALQKMEGQILQDLKKLQEDSKHKKHLEQVRQVKNWGYDPAESTNDNLKQAHSLLKTYLPSSVLKDPIAKEVLEDTDLILKSAGIFLYTVEAGLEGLALIYRQKTLNEAYQALEIIKKKYAEQSEPLPKQLKKWELDLDRENKSIKNKLLDFGIATSKNLISVVSFPIRLLSRFIPFAQYILTPFAIVGTILGLIRSSIFFSNVVKANITFKKWGNQFKKWQKQTQPHVNIKEQVPNPAGIKKHAPLPPKRTASLSQRQSYENKLEQLIQQSESLSQIKAQLYGIELDSSIQTKKDLHARYAQDARFKTDLINQYADIQMSFTQLQKTIDDSKNILQKRQALAQQKLILIRPQFQQLIPELKKLNTPPFAPKIEEILELISDPSLSLKELTQRLEATYSINLPATVKNTNEIKQVVTDSILTAYVDRQETIEQTLKESLKQLVAKKHKMEKGMVHFKLFKSSVILAISLLGAIASIGLGIAGLVTTPFYGAGAILLGLSVLSLTSSLSLLGLGTYINYRNKPSRYNSLNALFKVTEIQAQVAKLRSNLSNFTLKFKHKKLIKTIDIINELKLKKVSAQDPTYQKAMKRYIQVQEDFTKNEAKAKKWKEKVNQLENVLLQRGWQDFANYAHLKEDPDHFNALDRFKLGFEEANLDLMSQSTKNFLEVQLGIDMDLLEEQLKENPNAIKNTLQKFFNMDDAKLVSFMSRQNDMLKKGIIDPQI